MHSGNKNAGRAGNCRTARVLSVLEQRGEKRILRYCCFYENGAWTLLDYKTDRLRFLSEKDRGERLGEYAVQTAVYARAITELTGVPVREQHVYFLRERLDYRPDTETSAEGMIVPEYQVETAAEIRETTVTD